MSKPVLAAQLYTVRDFCQTRDSFAASMRKIRDIGYKAVQVSGIGPVADGDVKSIVEDNGLQICNTHIDYEQLWNQIDEVIAGLAVLGVVVILAALNFGPCFFVDIGMVLTGQFAERFTDIIRIGGSRHP